MGKGKGSSILKRDAEKIASKLGAKIKNGGAHQRAIIEWKGALITSFGIRHDRKAPHGHIPGQIFLSVSETLSMAKCHISKEEYFEIIAKRGKV